MKRSFAVASALLLLGLASAPFPPSAHGQEVGWTTLFDGSSLDGWNVLGDANWELADGADPEPVNASETLVGIN